MQSILLPLGALIVGVLITLVVCYFLPKEKIRTTNQAIEKEEQEAKLRIKDLEKEYLEKEKELTNQCNTIFIELSDKNRQLEEESRSIEQKIREDRDNWLKEKNNANIELLQQTKSLEVEVRGLTERRDNIIQTLEKEAKESGKIFKDQQLQIAEEQLEAAKKDMAKEFEQAKENAKKNYLELLAEKVAEFSSKMAVSQQEMEKNLAKLAELQSKVNSAVEVNKRAELDRQKKDFYRLQLSEIDIEEIKRIRSIEPYLRDKEPLNKVIWKSYYEKPYTDLIGRVIGQNKKMGIYKITNIENQMCYVGQAVDIADRWKQHIKRGIGADPPTRNKLYPAMLAIGVENFTFEIIEECTGAELNSREDYWQNFYHAKDFGYSIK